MSLFQPNILLVGAGAVGQIFAYHLHRAGARVGFYVREKYVEKLQRGLFLYELKMGSTPPRTHFFKDFDVYTTLEQVEQQDWDMVFLCMSSTGLVRNNWLEPFIKAVGLATVVSLQPGPNDRRYIEQFVAPSNHVQGMVGFIAFDTPLPGQSHPNPGMAYWFPPGSPSPMSGQLALAVTSLLKAGGLPSKRSKQTVSITAGFPTAGLMPFLLGLELSGWSFAQLEQGNTLKLVGRAIAEASQIISKINNAPIPAPQYLVRGWTLRPLLRVAPNVVPFDLETYLAYHFTKVGDQTRMTIETYLQMGYEAGLKTSNLETLYAQLLATEMD